MVHRISHQLGWLASCNTGFKVISGQRATSLKKQSDVDFTRMRDSRDAHFTQE